jgi:hypothetical protein
MEKQVVSGWTGSNGYKIQQVKTGKQYKLGQRFEQLCKESRIVRGRARNRNVPV